MDDRETPRMRKYGESKTTRIMMAAVPHVTSGSGLRKFQADGFLLDRVHERTGGHRLIRWEEESMAATVYPSFQKFIFAFWRQHTFPQWERDANGCIPYLSQLILWSLLLDSAVV